MSCHYYETVRLQCGTTSYLVVGKYHKRPFTDLLSIVASDMFVEAPEGRPDCRIRQFSSNQRWMVGKGRTKLDIEKSTYIIP